LGTEIKNPIRFETAVKTRGLWGEELKFKRVVVGGTFDCLHNGHVAILAKAFETGDQVLIGICSDEMELVKDSAGVQPLETRQRSLLELLRSRGWLERAKVCVISDPFGPAANDPELQAIVVSPETRKRAEELNRLRASHKLAPLQIVEIPFVLAEDGIPISSLRIRYGEIDPHGKLLKHRRPRT
jgi:pantetheine-phosphate adenylyltransferase